MKYNRIQVGMYLLLMAVVLGVCTMAIHARVPLPPEPQVALVNAELASDPADQTAQIIEVIEEVFSPLEPAIPGVVATMIAIADCESYGGNDGLLMHLDPAGELIRNPHSSAAGVFQVLLYTHRAEYEQLGLDPHSVEDNVRFARILVADRYRQGLDPFGAWECAG